MGDEDFDFKKSEDFNELWYEEALLYVMQQAKPYGLTIECAMSFNQFISEDFRNNEPMDHEGAYIACANAALLEWDI